MSGTDTKGSTRSGHAVIVVFSVFSAAFAMTLFAQEMRVEYLAGFVLSVDPASRLLSIEEASLDAEERTLSVPADAGLHKRGRAIELRGIRVGEPVSIEYENSPAGPVAQTVKVITQPGSDSAERSTV